MRIVQLAHIDMGSNLLVGCELEEVEVTICYCNSFNIFQKLKFLQLRHRRNPLLFL